MSKRIFRCNYLKNALPAHLENFVTYIGTREGVEKVESTTAHLPKAVLYEEQQKLVVYENSKLAKLTNG